MVVATVYVLVVLSFGTALYLNYISVAKKHAVRLQKYATADWMYFGKVQVGKDQEKAQSEKDSHSKNRGGKKPN